MQKKSLDYDFLKKIVVGVKSSVIELNDSFPYPLSPSHEEEVSRITADDYENFFIKVWQHFNRYQHIRHHFCVVEKKYIADAIPDYLEDRPNINSVNFGRIEDLKDYEVDLEDEKPFLRFKKEKIPVWGDKVKDENHENENGFSELSHIMDWIKQNKAERKEDFLTWSDKEDENENEDGFDDMSKDMVQIKQYKEDEYKRSLLELAKSNEIYSNKENITEFLKENKQYLDISDDANANVLFEKFKEEQDNMEKDLAKKEQERKKNSRK